MGNVNSFINLVYVSTSVIDNLSGAFVYSCSTINDIIKNIIKGRVKNILTSGIMSNSVNNNTIMDINTINTPHDFINTTL